MYLSKLEIIGFKSFAQKVNLAFDSGISSIVGPNGCGKTNIVDAIRWVLGEQRYSALRSEKMEDVIFNGTKFRKPLGMAEVSLVIENTKGILPSEYSQVTIGRRVYRSGESEYTLNRTLCRLKDILDLFMDTGMGADAYSVIELKMVETILSDKTDERRRLFEEAAGVTKYKHRRKAAYRKLESVQADLVRVNDIVSEVQKAVNSLERQARKAEQFNEVKSRLKNLEVDLMEREYAQLEARRGSLEGKLAVLSQDKSRIDVDLSREETMLDDLRNGMSDVERRLAEAQRDVSLQVEKLNRLEQKKLVAAERIKALDDNTVRYEAEKEALRVQKSDLEALSVTLLQRISELQAQAEQSEQELELKQAELKEVEGRLDAKRAELQSLNDLTITLVNSIAEAQSGQDRMKGRVENLQGRAGHAGEESAAYEHEIERLAGEIAALSTDDKQLRRSFTEAEMKYYEAETAKKELKRNIDELGARDLELRSEIDRKGAKIDFLKGLIESREGLPEGVRFLSSAEAWKPQRKLTVVDAVHAEERFRAAIETALGDHAGLIIVNSPADAATGIALLKKEQRGKVTFVCMDRIPVLSSRVRLPNIPGIIGWAADIARYDTSHASLFRYLLHDVLVVDTYENAQQVAAALAGVRCVTLEGEIVTGAGIVKAGSKRQDEGGIIGKQEQIQELQAEVAELTGQREDLRRSQEGFVREHDGIVLKTYAEVVKGIEKEMNAAEMRIAQLEFEKKRAGDIIAKNVEEISTLMGEAEKLLAEIDAGRPALDRLKEEKSSGERRVGAVMAELEALDREWNNRSTVVNELGIAIVRVRGEHKNAQNDLKRAETSLGDVEETLRRRDQDIRAAQEEIARTKIAMESHEDELGALQNDLASLELRKTEVETESADIRNEIHRLDLKIREERRHHDDSLKALHDIELKLADVKAKADHLVARALEEYETQLTLKQYPEDEFVDFAALRDEIQAMREKVKSLGNINFAAFEEYTTEKERFEFLSSQRKDLLEAERTLLATIEEINTTAQRKFLETFGLIRTNFIETFKSLFDPGDECDLKLEDGVDPLEAGIEIIAKPRGKRPTSIDLLSGGEKTLTAIALLFAIYLVKPSPFCILDEVDAPLDDANIDRFTRILRKFSDNTQFIVVTHNKRTMEAANALYGVTMEEEGVSKLVTVRFNQSAEVKSAAVVSG